MIEHESDLWPKRRWAIQQVSGHIPRAAPRVSLFVSARERDAWVAKNVLTRVAVGKRHPAVKALRQQWRQEALRKLTTWKEKHS